MRLYKLLKYILRSLSIYDISCRELVELLTFGVHGFELGVELFVGEPVDVAPGSSYYPIGRMEPQVTTWDEDFEDVIVFSNMLDVILIGGEPLVETVVLASEVQAFKYVGPSVLNGFDYTNLRLKKWHWRISLTI